MRLPSPAKFQNSPFPQHLASGAGVELEAIAKRLVRPRDYYISIQLSPTHVAIAIADLSGKGTPPLSGGPAFSSLRSQKCSPTAPTPLHGRARRPLNKHLVRTTGDDRFATFFTRGLRECHSDSALHQACNLPLIPHLPRPIRTLDKGGMVLRVEDYGMRRRIVVGRTRCSLAYSDAR